MRARHDRVRVMSVDKGDAVVDVALIEEESQPTAEKQ